MIKPKKFKKSIFGGFNRRDVIAYINDLSETMAELESENSALRSDNAVLQARASEAAQKVSELQESLQLTPNACDAPPAEPGENRIGGFEVREDIISDLMDTDASRYETKDVHDLSLDIGNILLAARECADDIIKEAEDKSKEMKASALKSSEDLRSTLNKTQLYLKSLSDDIDEAIGKFEAE